MIKNQIISLNGLVMQGKDNIVSDMGGETVMLSVQNGKYYNLGELGGRIWDLIGEPIIVHEIVRSLMEEYDVEQNQCEQHVLSFLETLFQEGLIQLVEDETL